jgi:hypothetical protein
MQKNIPIDVAVWWVCNHANAGLGRKIIFPNLVKYFKFSRGLNFLRAFSFLCISLDLIVF